MKTSDHQLRAALLLARETISHFAGGGLIRKSHLRESVLPAIDAALKPAPASPPTEPLKPGDFVEFRPELMGTAWHKLGMAFASQPDPFTAAGIKVVCENLPGKPETSFGVIQEGRHKGHAFKVAWTDPPERTEEELREAQHVFGYYGPDDQPSDSALADLFEARLSGDKAREERVRVVNGFTVIIDDDAPAGVILFRRPKS